MTNSETNLRLFYEREIFPFYHLFREMKKKALQKAVIFSLLTATLCFIIQLIIRHELKDTPVLLYYLSGVIIIYSGLANLSSGLKDRKRIFRYEILPRIVEFTGLNYRKTADFAKKDYIDSKLFDSADRLLCYDAIEGYYDGVMIRFAQIESQKKCIHKSGKYHRIEWISVFKGIILAADFNKKFKGVTIVHTDQESAFIGDFWAHFIQKNFQKHHGNLAIMDNPEFEKIFKTFTSDQIEARYLLTGKFMEKAVLLSKQYKNGKISFSFNKNKFFIGFTAKKLFFQYKRGDITYDLIKKIHEEITAFREIVTMFDLITKIWTKN